MIPFRPDIPPHVADVIRLLHPDLKQLIKSAIRAIAANPHVESRSSESFMGYGSIASVVFASSMPLIESYESFA